MASYAVGGSTDTVGGASIHFETWFRRGHTIRIKWWEKMTMTMMRKKRASHRTTLLHCYVFTSSTPSVRIATSSPLPPPCYFSKGSPARSHLGAGDTYKGGCRADSSRCRYRVACLPFNLLFVVYERRVSQYRCISPRRRWARARIRE